MNMIYTLYLFEVFVVNFLLFFFLQSIEKWNCRNVVDLLVSFNLYRYVQFFKDQEISGRKFKTMSKEDLQVSITVVRLEFVMLVGRQLLCLSLYGWVRFYVEKLKWEDFVLRIKFSFYVLNLFKESI